MTLSHFVGQCRMDDILSAMDVRLDALHRVVLRCRNMLQSSGVNDYVHAFHSLDKALAIPYVAKKIAHARTVEFCAISYCFNSSREKTISRRGWQRSSSVATYLRPKDPVPPVIRIALSSNIAVNCQPLDAV